MSDKSHHTKGVSSIVKRDADASNCGSKDSSTPVPDDNRVVTISVRPGTNEAVEGESEHTETVKPKKLNVRFAIQINDRELRYVSGDCLGAIHQYNDRRPRLFLHGALVSQVVSDGTGNISIRTTSPAALRGVLTRSADFFRITKDGFVRVSPPKDAVEDILALDAEKLQLPHLAGITQAPCLRPDGSVLNAEGYDSDLELYYNPRKGFCMEDIPESPTAADVREAVELVGDILYDFPFTDEASRANAIAMLLTPIVRALITDNVPMAIVDANHPGTGKGLLVDVMSIIATGRRASMSPMPSSPGHYAEEEMRKRLTAAFAAGKAIVVWDNVGRIDSPSLAAALTMEFWSDRILGHSREINVRPRTIMLAASNNLGASTEIARRCYWIRMESPTSQPWRRTGFKHPKLLGYVRANRAALLRALLTIGSAWLKAGAPAADTPEIGSFEEWCRTVGGILKFAGIEKFLGNLEQFHAKVDSMDLTWEAFLLAVDSAFSGGVFTSYQLAERINQNNTLREALPPEFLDAVANPFGRNLQRALGNSFREKVNMPFGPDNIRIEKVGLTSNKVVEWVIKKG